jgi:hypothetical protein
MIQEKKCVIEVCFPAGADCAPDEPKGVVLGGGSLTDPVLEGITPAKSKFQR